MYYIKWVCLHYTIVLFKVEETVQDHIMSLWVVFLFRSYIVLSPRSKNFGKIRLGS